MRSDKALEMLNKGQVEELQAILRDEIYNDVLKVRPGAKQRYSAMKKYFSYVVSSREACQKPCIIDFEGQPYTSFCNAYSLVLTKEPCGAIELFTDVDRYPNVTRLINYDGTERKVNLAKVFAEAKTLGYKLKKSEVNGNGYLMLYDGAYYRVGLVESTYAIINDGEEATIFHAEDGKFSPITIQTSIGIAVVMAVRYEPEEGDGVIIIDVE